MKKVPGVSVVDWDVDFEAELHTVLVRKMREILAYDAAYAYLSESCYERLREIQFLARGCGILEKAVTQLSEKKFAIFPWIGTRQLFTLHYFLLKNKIKSRILWRTCIYLEVILNGTAGELENVIGEILSGGPDMENLPLPENIQIKYKYNEYIPAALLRKQFIEDFLDFGGMVQDMSEPFR